jgi:hypothetical protein
VVLILSKDDNKLSEEQVKIWVHNFRGSLNKKKETGKETDPKTKTKSRTACQFFMSVTHPDRGGMGTHIIHGGLTNLLSDTHWVYSGKWIVSVSVKTEERVYPSLHLSISKSYQLSSTHSPLSTLGDERGDCIYSLSTWFKDKTR